MPSLPRIRRSRARGGSPVLAPAPVVHELTASGLTWVNVVSPDVETAQGLAARFGWHPLDVEDIVSKRQRPKVDDYEDDGYLFAVLHFPFYDTQVQRLNAAELDIFVGHDYVVTIPNHELTASGLTWVNVVSPDVETAQELAERFGFHPLDVEDIVSKRQRPKVDDYEEDGYLFAVLHFPIYDNQVQRLNAAELDVFVGHDFVVTIPNRELRPVTRLFARCEEDDLFREQLFARGSGRLLYEVLDDLFDYCFPILDKIAHKLDGIEDEMFEGASQEVVRDLSNVKQEIISYRKIIKPERSTLRVLEGRVQRFLPQELDLYFDDIVDAAERIWDLLDNYKEVVEGLEQTNESVISHRQNDILRILTVFSVVLLPLTLITGIFGMNVRFPGFETAHAWWAIVGGMLVVLGGLLGFFRYKRWL